MNTFQLTESEQVIKQKIADLKAKSGSHSPSISTLKQTLSDVEFKIDACFLSNPYATDLFLKWLEQEIISAGKLRQLLEFYPAQNNRIAELLSKSIHVESNKLFIANGASEAIDATMKNFAGKKICVILPTFSSYYEFIKPDQEAVYYSLRKENNFQFSVEDYIEFIKQNEIDTAILINPNNPNGGYVSQKELAHILHELSNLQTVIVDESFIHFAYEDNDYNEVSIANLTESYPNLIVIKSMSKDFGIAGVRAGYAVMSPERVQQLLQRGYLWNSNGLAEYFFGLYSNPNFLNEYEPLRKRHIAETQKFISQLSEIKLLKVYPSMGNFVLVELPSGYNAGDITIALLARFGVYLRDCSDKKGLEGQFIRIASRTQAENEHILQAFSSIFQTK